MTHIKPQAGVGLANAAVMLHFLFAKTEAGSQGLGVIVSKQFRCGVPISI